MPPLQQTNVCNRLLRTLNGDDFERLAPALELVTLAVREVLIPARAVPTYVATAKSLS